MIEFKEAFKDVEELNSIERETFCFYRDSLNTLDEGVSYES
jgi:hypothetical protein